jgi:putative PIN family toxin of toxin-antitoxin system
MATVVSDKPCVVLDTNVLLDIWVFQDTNTALLHEHLAQQRVRWLATSAMRQELWRVLAYPHIEPRLAQLPRTAAEVMAAFDRWSHTQPEAPRSPYVCKDADDQKFIDLAVTHRALLVSKDRQVLRLTHRLARLGVVVTSDYSQAPSNGTG